MAMATVPMNSMMTSMKVAKSLVLIFRFFMLPSWIDLFYMLIIIDYCQSVHSIYVNRKIFYIA